MRTHLSYQNASDIQAAVSALTRGVAIGHGFGNFYAITAKPDTDTVRMINRMKGRPLDQPGSITTTPWRMHGLFNWDRLPAGLPASKVCELMERLWTLGPFGFRGPARDGLPEILTATDNDLVTTQIIYPGLSCPSNKFIGQSLQALGVDCLYTTSGNPSRHQTGAADEPVHYRGEALASDFASEANFVVLHQEDDQQAVARHPHHDPMSTTILALHKLGPQTTPNRPQLVVERHGSMTIETLSQLTDTLGFDLTLGPNAQTRLGIRQY